MAAPPRALGVGFVIGTAAALLARRRDGLAAAAVAARRRLAQAKVPPTADAGEDGARLEELSKADLYRRAQAAGIPGRSEMSKAELIAALREGSERNSGS